jgi:TolB-like protein
MKLKNLFVTGAAMLLATMPVMSAMAQSKPTVAVLNFNNGALGKSNEELAPLGKGLQDILIQELAANTGIRVVERDQINKIMEEQKLGTSGAVDKETAVKIGKLLGAKHMVTGGFQTDPKATQLNVTLRVFNVETGEIEYTTSARDKPDNLFALINKLAMQTNKGLKLPDIPKQLGQAREEKAEKIPFQAVMLYSRGIKAKDAGDSKEAITLFKQVLDKFPDYDAPKTELAKLGVK